MSRIALDKTMSPKQERFLARVVALLGENRFLPSSPLELANSLAVPVQAIEAILALGVRDGQICETSQSLFYGREQLNGIIRSLESVLPEGGYDPVSFRNSTGLSRRLADGLFQLLNETGAVRRDGVRWFLNGI